MMGYEIKLLTWNVKGMNDRKKMGKLMSYIATKGADIVLLQETHLTRAMHLKAKQYTGYMARNSTYYKGSRGVATLIRNKLPFIVMQEHADDQGRMLVIFGLLLGIPVVIANVYAPNVDDPKFINEVFEVAGRWGEVHIMIGGDFNCILHPSLDKSSNIRKPLCKSAKMTLQLMDTYNIVDAWRVRHPDNPGYSFYSPAHKMYSRIDRWMVSTNVYCKMLEIDVDAATHSDHNAINIILKWAPKYHKLTSWAFRPQMLTDVLFESKLRENIVKFFEENKAGDTSHQVRWEAFKCTIRGMVASAEAGMKKQLQKEIDRIGRQMAKLEEEHRRELDDTVLARLLEVRHEYNRKIEEEQKLRAVTRNAIYYWQADKPNTLLARLLKEGEPARQIMLIEKGDGENTSDPKEIIDTITEHLRSIYTERVLEGENKLEEYLGKITFRKISEAQTNRLNDKVDRTEIESAIKEINRGKAPGHDGIGSELYKRYAQLFSPILLEMFEEALMVGELKGRLNEAKITLLPKPGGNSLKCTDYRPLSLINTDVKLLAKILANRLLPILPEIISQDQTGFIPGRDTSMAIRRVHDVIAGLEENSTVALVSLDAYKAFDTIRWDYLFGVMERFGIEGDYIRWVKVLYKNPKAKLVLNETWSEEIKICSGTRQGCPLSALLFALGMEPLLVMLNENMKKAGAQTKGIASLTIAYADDLMLCIDDPKVNMAGIITLIEKHGIHSGFKINWAKSVYFPVGANAPQMSPDQRLKTNDKWIKYLGIKVAIDNTEAYHLNYTEKLDEVRIKLDKWGQLPLNIAARITIIKMNILPKMLYIFNNVPVQVPVKFFKELRSCVTQFVWNKKVPRVAYSTLTRPYAEGGFEIPDFKMYYQAAQIQHAIKWLEAETTEPQVMMERGWFDKHKANRLLMDNKVKGKGDKGPPTVSLKTWREVNDKIADGMHYSKFISIWDVSINNSRLNEKMYSPWGEKGILMLQDLYEGNKLKEDKDLVDKAGGGMMTILKWQWLKRGIYNRWETTPVEPLENRLIAHAVTTAGCRHQISHVYKIIREETVTPNDHLKTRWEESLGIIITDKVWKEACGSTKNIAVNMKLRMTHYKYLTQSYYTPARLNKIYKRNDIGCVKCNEIGADLVHVTWKCEKMKVFWDEVFKTISEICGYMIPNKSECVYLYDLPKMDIISYRWVKLSIVVAKLMVSRRWTTSKVPSVAEWKAYMVYCASQEQELQLIMVRSQTPKDIWAQFREYLRKPNTEPNSEDSE